MIIEKAIKKQKKSCKNSIFAMVIISLVLPFITYLTNRIGFWYIVFLILIEILSVLAIIALINNARLKFECLNSNLKIEIGLLKTKILVLCDKVVLVHTQKSKEDMEIIIILESRVQKKMYRRISRIFYRKYPNITHEYKKIKRRDPKKEYSYILIKKGGFLKYKLLDTIYRNCVGAVYTSESIHNIKIARGQVQI